MRFKFTAEVTQDEIVKLGSHKSEILSIIPTITSLRWNRVRKGDLVNPKVLSSFNAHAPFNQINR